MSINSGSINSYSINGTADAASSELISETIILSLQSLESVLKLVGVADELGLVLTYSSGQNTNIAVEDSISALDSILLSFNRSINEGLVLTPNIVGTILKISTILEGVILTLDHSHRAILKNTLLEDTVLSDDNNFGILKVISEVLNIVDSIVTKSLSYSELVEIIDLDAAVLSNRSLLVSLLESLSIEDNVNTASIIKDVIEDLLYLSIGIEKDLEYISYLLSPETFSVSTYSNYNFTGSCVYENTPLFINDDGLYKYGGTLDINDSIVSSIQTAALSFGTSNLKQVPNIYLGISNSNRLLLKVAVDGQADILYNLTKKTDGLQTQNIPVGKGLIGRYFQFELVTQESTQFELESIEFLPVTLKRKL